MVASLTKLSEGQSSIPLLGAPNELRISFIPISLESPVCLREAARDSNIAELDPPDDEFEDVEMLWDEHAIEESLQGSP